jgi:phage tail P2-like protein
LNPDTFPAGYCLACLGVLHRCLEPSWTEEQKRGAIKSSVEVHKHKGTIGALAALGGLGYDIEVKEWFEHHRPDVPYTFSSI